MPYTCINIVVFITLANEGVGLAPYHSFDGAVPAALKAEIEAIRAGIIAGTVNVGG